MKNINKIILLALMSLAHLADVKSVPFWQKVFPVVTTGLSYPLFTELSHALALPAIEKLYIPCATAALAHAYISYASSKTYKALLKNSPAFYNQCHEKETEQWIKEKFNKNKTITDLPISTIESGLEEARLVKDDTSHYLLQLSKRFPSQKKSIQKGLIAHEETHFSQNHHHKLKQTFIAALTSTSLVMTQMPTIDPTLSTLFAYYFCIPVYAAHTVEGKVRRKLEREADLLNKTPEELLGLILLDAGEKCDDKKINDLLCSADVQNFAKKHFKEKTPFFKIPFTDTSFPSREKRLTYLTLQLHKQIHSPHPQDIPGSIKECNDALSCYFDKEEHYLTGIPAINAPLVQKRVDFLRARLTELQNKKA